MNRTSVMKPSALLAAGIFLMTSTAFAQNPAQAGASPPAQAGTVQGEDFSTLTSDQIRTRLIDSCVFELDPETPNPNDTFASKCICYGNQVMRTMTSLEMDELKATGSFNQTARAKAEGALAMCKLKPASGVQASVPARTP